MTYFEFTGRTKIIYGNNTITQVGTETKKLKGNKCIIITDKIFQESNLTNKIKESLNNNGIEILGVFSDVPQDSDLEVVDLAYRTLNAKEADIVIALGGGSTLDTAKAINIYITENGTLPQGINILHKPLLPLIAIPTTAGTGSEVTQAAVIKDTKNKIKLTFTGAVIVPNVAILDPEITISLPPSLTASTGMDAMTHAVEAIHSTAAEPISDALALHSARLIYNYLPIAAKDGKNIEARGNMLLASCIAGMAFTNALVGCVHAMAHACGGLCGIPHGIANGILLSYGMEFNLGACEDRYAEIGKNIGILTAGKTNRQISIDTIQAVHQLKKDIGLPLSLKEVGITEKDIPKIADLTLIDGTIFTNPISPSKADIEKILKKALTGAALTFTKPKGIMARMTEAAQKVISGAEEKPKPPLSIEDMNKIIDLFSKKIFAIPQISEKLKTSKLVINFKYYSEQWGEIEPEVTADCSDGQEIKFYVGPCDVQPSVTLRMHGDTAHKFWVGKLNLIAALAKGEISAKGALPQLMVLLPAAKLGFQYYKETLEELKQYELLNWP